MTKWASILVLISLINYNHEKANGASVEPCLSSQLVDQSSLPAGIILPLDCQCTYTDLVCANLKIYDPNTNVTNMPNLSVIFQQSLNPVNYVLPKYRYLILGYNLLAKAFDGVKFVDPSNLTAQLDQNIYINFLETSSFPRDLMTPMGNLDQVPRDMWPKVNIIITNEVTMPLVLESNSFSNLKIDRFTLQFIDVVAKNLKSNFLESSQVDVLEIKKSNGFKGFEPLPFGTSITSVNAILIDTCPNFVLTQTSIPLYSNLTNVAIRSSNLRELAGVDWTNYFKLESLDLSSNLITNLEQKSFQGLEDRLASLDLSKNPLDQLNWAAFDNLLKLKRLDLSNSRMPRINSWPRSAGLEKVSLLGYDNAYFGDKYICLFDSFENEMKRANLTTTLLEFDKDFKCDCFLFYVYRNYRLSQENLFRMRQSGSRIPACYLSLLQNENPSEIQREETKCNFDQILNRNCPKQSGTTAETTGSITPTATTTTTTSSSSSSSQHVPISLSTSQTKTGEFISTTCYTENTQPGLTTITIGNQTTITTLPFSPITTVSIIKTEQVRTNASSSHTQQIYTSLSTSAAKQPCDDDDDDGQDPQKLSTGSIVAIVVLGIVAFLLLILIISLIVYFRNRMRSSMMIPTSHSRNHHQIPTN